MSNRRQPEVHKSDPTADSATCPAQNRCGQRELAMVRSPLVGGSFTGFILRMAATVSSPIAAEPTARILSASASPRRGGSGPPVRSLASSIAVGASPAGGVDAYGHAPFLVRNIVGNHPTTGTPSSSPCTLSRGDPKTVQASPGRREEASDARRIGRHTHRHHRDTGVPRDRDLRDTTAALTSSSFSADLAVARFERPPEEISTASRSTRLSYAHTKIHSEGASRSQFPGPTRSPSTVALDPIQSAQSSRRPIG
jgi:hypothetical protein